MMRNADFRQTTRSLINRVLRPTHLEIRQIDPDAHLDSFLMALFGALGINCVIDVGARHGEFGQLLRHHGFRGTILSFEPVHENVKILRQVAERDKAWHVFPFALGSEPSQALINVATASNYSSFLEVSEYGISADAKMQTKEQMIVEVHRLDALFDEITAHISDPHIYLKMDTQGWDMEVFRGAANCLDHICALQSELSLQPLYDNQTNWLAALTEFQAAGFEISNFFTVFRDDKLRVSEMDCVMVNVG
jgi:FkbM family methyltransferase